MSEVYCSKCKEHRNASLKTELWRLPPVLVVHLKRFQYTTYSRRKLHNLVKFPVDNLDMSSYMVKELHDGEERAAVNEGDEATTVLPATVITTKHEGFELEEENTEDTDSRGAMFDGALGVENGSTEDNDSRGAMFDGALGVEDGRSEKNYELYAVVHHLGAMSAGHYVASIKSRATGKWVCFNDNILMDTNENELVSDSAYILFYVRKDMAGMDISDVYPHVEGAGLTEQEVTQLLNSRKRDKCSVM